MQSLGPTEGKEKFSEGSTVEKKELECFLIYLRVKLRTFDQFLELVIKHTLVL